MLSKVLSAPSHKYIGRKSGSSYAEQLGSFASEARPAAMIRATIPSIRSGVQWMRRKFKRFSKHPQLARSFLDRYARAHPQLFVHWKLGVFPCGLSDRSRMSGEVHVRFLEGPGLRFLRPTQPYIPLKQGFMYLTAVLDWHSRYVLSWELSNTLDGAFCISALKQALSQGQPEIFNTDQGAQFTSQAFIDVLQASRVTISMDGRGRALDNVFVERLWRSVKYEDIYLRNYESASDLEAGLQKYFRFYCRERGHQSLGYQTPWEVYSARRLQRRTK